METQVERNPSKQRELHGGSPLKFHEDRDKLLDSGSETYGPYYGPVSPAPDDPGVPQYTYSITGSTSPDTYLDRLYGLGVGWSLDFPSVEFTDNSMYLHYQGSIYKLTPGTGGSYTLDHYAIGDLKFQSDTNYAGASYSLRRKDGMIWYFRSDGRLLVIQNQFGNTIRFEYDSSNRIARIFDTVNWKVEFNYNAPLPTGRSLSFIPQSVVSVSVYASPSAEIPEFTWYYALGPTSHPDKTKLAAVIPPEPQTPITEYLYTKCQTSFIPYVEGYGTGPSINYYYLTLDTIVHPSGGLTRFDYGQAHKDVDNDDPSEDNPSDLGYFRVTARWDELAPGLVVNRSEFTYVDWDSARSRSVTTRTPRRSADDPGIQPATEVWEFNREHELVAYEVTGESSGESRNQVEKRRTEYELNRQLPVRETTTITLGGYSRQEVVVNTWDELGNLLSTTNAAGKITEYTYDPTYSLLTSKLERTSELISAGRLTTYTLDSTRKLVQEIKQGMAEKVTATNTYSGPPSTTLYAGSTWSWIPSGEIDRVSLGVQWCLGWSEEGQQYEAAYVVRYRPVGASSWAIAISKRHTDMYQYEGSDTVEFTVPLGRYEIRVEVNCVEWLSVQSATARGPVSYWQYVGPTTRTVFTYDANYPGNLKEVVAYSFDNKEESRSEYKYDEDWNAYPAAITIYTQDGTVATKAKYDALGRVIEYTTQDGATISKSEYRYDRLGRLIAATLPEQAPGAFRPTRNWTYDVPADSAGVQRGVAWYVVRRDEIGPQAGQLQPSYQWVREGFDKLGRFKEAAWGKGGADLASVSWNSHPTLTVSYDSVGRVKSETDALDHTTSYAYDAFGRKISILYPGQTEATEQSWYVVAGPPPVTYPAIPLTPPGDPSKFAWVSWEKSQDADQHPVYRGYDVAGRLVWSATNPKDNQSPAAQPLPVVKTETTSDDFRKGTLTNVSPTASGDLTLTKGNVQKVVVWGTDGYPYAAAWISNATTIVNTLKNRGWQTKTASEIKTLMQTLIQRADARGTVVLFLGQAPDTVLESCSASCTLRRFLDVGGRILWISDCPIYYVGHADGTRTQWGWSGSGPVLGVTSSYGQAGTVSVTADGVGWTPSSGHRKGAF